MNSKNNQNKTLRGYVHNEKFGPYCMPVVFQNKLLKQYCDERKINFALPQGEIVFSKSFIQLRSLIEKLKHNEGIVMMSIFMLPQKSQDRNKILFNFINKKIECHFLFENVVAKNKKEYEYINNLIKLNLYQKDNSKIFNWIKKNEIIKIS
tara:strand:- start:6697 stop:7149 length:453 start_codon:yes stop_codon:yes gene_type:complete